MNIADIILKYDFPTGAANVFPFGDAKNCLFMVSHSSVFLPVYRSRALFIE